MSRLSRGKDQLKAVLASMAAESSRKIIPWRKDEEASR
jgi:hypothetical protein